MFRALVAELLSRCALGVMPSLTAQAQLLLCHKRSMKGLTCLHMSVKRVASPPAVVPQAALSQTVPFGWCMPRTSEGLETGARHSAWLFKCCRGCGGGEATFSDLWSLHKCQASSGRHSLCDFAAHFEQHCAAACVHWHQMPVMTATRLCGLSRLTSNPADCSLSLLLLPVCDQANSICL